MVARIFIAILVAGVVGAISGQSQRRAFEWDRVKAIYAFGDSYSFVGGLRGYPKFTFIGDEINFAFTPEELLTNTILPNVTSSGGNNWLQFLTGCYQGSPFDCPKQLWDFAFAGADIDVKQLPLHANFVTSLVRQVEQFLAYADPVLPKQQPDESLIVWWIGINDVSDVVNNRTITDFPAFWESEMESLFGAVDQVQAAVQPAAHLFLNVNARDVTPGTLNNPTTQVLIRARTAEYNDALARRATLFADRVKSDGTIVVQFDAHAWFDWALDNAAQLGFTNTTGFCQCDDWSYFWYDTGHPSEAVHRHLAHAVDAKLREC